LCIESDIELWKIEYSLAHLARVERENKGTSAIKKGGQPEEKRKYLVKLEGGKPWSVHSMIVSIKPFRNRGKKAAPKSGKERWGGGGGINEFRWDTRKEESTQNTG